MLVLREKLANRPPVVVGGCVVAGAEGVVAAVAVCDDAGCGALAVDVVADVDGAVACAAVVGGACAVVGLGADACIAPRLCAAIIACMSGMGG